MVEAPQDSSAAAPRLRSRRGARHEWLLLGTIMAAVGLFGFWNRFSEYGDLQAEQRQMLAAQALAIDENLSRQLLGAGAALHGVRSDLAVWPGAEVGVRSDRRLTALSDAMPGVRTMLVLDRNGRVLASNRPELKDREFSGREYFRTQRERLDLKRVSLSPPFVSALGVFSMNLTVGVAAADGSFGGVVTATLDPDYFKTLLRSTLYAPDMRASVAHGDGPVMIMEPPVDKLTGTSFDQPGSFFRRHLDSGQIASVMTGMVAATGEQRMMAQRTVQPVNLALDRPMIVSVSRSIDAMFAPWRRQTAVDAMLYALLVATASFALIAMQRRQRKVETLEAQREQLLVKSAERLELALRGADLALWDLDVRTGTSVINERWNSMLGLPHQAQHSGPEIWRSRLHPDDRERVEEAQRAHLEGRKPRFEETYRMRHADGHWVWILDRAQVLERDAHGAPLRMVGTHMDTTGSMEGQLALRANEERLRQSEDFKTSVLDSLSAHIAVLDRQGDIVAVNDAWRRFAIDNGAPEPFVNPLGVSYLGICAEAVGGPSGIEAETAVSGIRDVLAGGRAEFHLEYPCHSPTEQRWFRMSVTRMRGASGGAVVSHIPVTEIKLAEQRRQSLELQLREAQKMESIGTLAGGIAHDFNNILAAILGNVALARQDVGTGHAALASLDQVHRAGLRARHLVQQILSFSRRDQRGFTVQALGPVIDETLGLLRALLPAGVELDAVVPDPALAVRGDSTQLQQVLMNLCTNAWQALPDQGGRVRVGADRVDPDEALRQRVPEMPQGECVHLWVSDNGSGIDGAIVGRIFDPFFTTKGVGQGTGLGLSVAHGIVRAHEGAIAVDTAPGRGTTFHLYFRLPAPQAPEAAPPPAAAIPRGAGQRVLYIDDDEVMVLMVERLLARAGFEVTVATDADAAVAWVRAQPQAFDVVVTDFNMPGLSGLDVAAQLAGIRPGLPVVISSGYVTEALRAQAEQLGVRALMQKENTFDELAGLLLGLLAAEPT